MDLFESIFQKVFPMLETKLPSFLTYHSPKHTTYVIEKSIMLGELQKVRPHDLFLIKTAALLHDIGFIRQFKDHEEAGCKMAGDLLAEYDLPDDDLKKICGMIMATKIPQTPHSINEMIVADADLEYLGTDSFHDISRLLYEELHYVNPELDEEGYRQIQIDFLKGHQYHTDFCRTYREPKKQEHLMELLRVN